ncbi:MAG: hypothetical protein Q9160_008327 [Pyrenula sp. 1 TL-2023]
MAALPPPDPSIPDVNQGPRVLVAGWIQAGVSIIIVGLRFYTGIRVIRRLDLGDWLMLFALIITNLANIIIIVAQCQHINKLWDLNAPGTCWSRNVQVYAGYLQGGVNCTTDLIVTFLPIIILGNLKMKLRIKIALGVLMTMSIFAFVAAVIKTIQLGGLGSHGDFTYDTAPFIIWFTIENYLSIIAASVPTIRPLFLSWRKTTISSQSYQMNSYNQKGSRGYMRHNDSDFSKSQSRDLETTIKKYPTTVTVHPRTGSEDSGSETNILSDAGPQRNITKTTRVDIRFEDDILSPGEKNVSPRAF